MNIKNKTRKEVRTLGKGKKQAIAVAKTPVVVETEKVVKVETKTVKEEEKGAEVTIDLKKLWEFVRTAKEVPADLKIKAGDVEVNIHDAFKKAFEVFSVTTPCVVSRTAFLNLVCNQQEIAPRESKRLNKEENKTNTMYGNGFNFQNQFDADGANYFIFGFLKYKIFKGEKFVAYKYGRLEDKVVFVLLPIEKHEDFMSGKMLNDEKMLMVQ